MSNLWRDSRPTARKSHRCDQCNTTAQPGTAYHRGEGLYDGEWQACKTCIPCADLARDMYAAGFVGENGDGQECYPWLPEVDYWREDAAISPEWVARVADYQMRVQVVTHA